MPVFRRKTQRRRRGTPLTEIHMSVELQRYFESIGINSLEGLFCALLPAYWKGRTSDIYDTKELIRLIKDRLGEEVTDKLERDTALPRPSLGLVINDQEREVM